MGRRTRLWLVLILCAALLSPACRFLAGEPAPPAPVPSPAGTQPSPALPTATLPAPTAPPPTQALKATSPALPPLITAENAARLAFTSLALPEFPARLLGVGEGAALPGDLSPAPDLLVYTGANLYPLRLQPAEIGQPVAWPAPGEVLDFAPDLTSLAVRASSGQVQLVDLTGAPLHTLAEPSPYSASYSPDGRWVAVTSQSEFAASVYDAASGEPVARLTGFETAAPVYGVDVAPGGKTIAWHARATLVLQDVATGQLGQKFAYQDFIGALAFSPAGDRLAVYVESKLLLYEIPGARLLAELSLSQPITSLAWSPDGRLIAGGYGPALQLWDTAALTPIASLPGPNPFTGQVTFSPDGTFIVTTHEDNTVAVWRVSD